MLLTRFPRLGRLMWRMRAYVPVATFLVIAAGVGFGVAFATSNRLESTRLVSQPAAAPPAPTLLKPSEGSAAPIIEKQKKARRPRVKRTRPRPRRTPRRTRRRTARAAPAPAPVVAATPAPTAVPTPAATAAPPPPRPPVRQSPPPKPQSKPAPTFDSSG